MLAFVRLTMLVVCEVRGRWLLSCGGTVVAIWPPTPPITQVNKTRRDQRSNMMSKVNTGSSDKNNLA